jgi:hypothetical protein
MLVIIQNNGGMTDIELNKINYAKKRKSKDYENYRVYQDLDNDMRDNFEDLVNSNVDDKRSI